MGIKFNYEDSFVGKDEMENLKAFVRVSHELLHEKKGPGNDYLGFMDLPQNYDREEFRRIKEAAKKIKIGRAHV